VPPYAIFHDVTLSAIARLRPADKDALASISGVGRSKLARYGEEVLSIVRAAAGPATFEDIVRAPKGPRQPAG